MSFRHGQAKRGRHNPIFDVWTAMLDRCNRSNSKVYHNYGGRGIQVCERWQDFRNFFADMGPRPDGLTLERKDNDGNYEPGNCCWATRKEQRANTRDRSDQHWFYGHGPNGEMIVENNQSHVARIFELNQRHISGCLNNERTQHKGWKFRWIT